MSKTRRSICVLTLMAVCTMTGAASGSPSQPDATLDDVLNHITKDQVVELTRSLIKIPSDYSEDTAANHNEIADYLAERLRGLGMDVQILEPEPHYPIVIGRLKGSTGKPVLGVMGHYNTVPVGDRERWTVDPFEGVLKGNKLYGRGAADQKGGIAAVLVATQAILDAGVPLRGDLVHAYIPGEGAQDHVLPHVVDNQPELIKTDWYLDTDGGPDIIQIAAGHIWLKMTVEGKSAHPGGSQPWVNAAYKLAKVLVAIEDVDSWMTYEKHALFASLEGKPRVQVGTLKAGTAVNQIPDVAEARIDIRLNPKQTVEGVMGELNGVVDRLKKEDPELELTLEKLPGTQHVPYHHWAAITPDEPLVKVIREVAAARMGREPGFRGSRGGGRPDLWRIGAKWISWSANVGENEHAPDEWLDVDALYRSAQIYAEIILKMVQ